MSLTELVDGKAFINGNFLKADDTFPNIHPGDGSVIGNIADSSGAEIGIAAMSASLAQKKWAKTSLQERGAILTRISELIREYGDELAMDETLDAGN